MTNTIGKVGNFFFARYICKRSATLYLETFFTVEEAERALRRAEKIFTKLNS